MTDDTKIYRISEHEGNPHPILATIKKSIAEDIYKEVESKLPCTVILIFNHQGEQQDNQVYGVETLIIPDKDDVTLPSGRAPGEVGRARMEQGHTADDLFSFFVFDMAEHFMALKISAPKMAGQMIGELLSAMSCAGSDEPHLTH